MNHDELRSFAFELFEDFGPDVDALTVVERAPMPLSQDELDFVFSVIDDQ